jgi:hypothetical protein
MPLQCVVRRYNSIFSLKSSDGSPIYGRDNIGSYLVDHFSKKNSTSHPPLIVNLLDLVSDVIYVEENARICTIFYEHEIFVAS